MDEVELKPGCELSRDAKDALIKLKNLLTDEEAGNDDVRDAALEMVDAILEDDWCPGGSIVGRTLDWSLEEAGWFSGLLRLRHGIRMGTCTGP